MQKFNCTIALLSLITVTAMAQPGALDSGFGTSGTATYLPQPILNKVYGVALQNDHKILLGGYALAAGVSRFTLGRLLSDGSPDATFGTNGFISTPIGTDGSAGYALAVQPDGKILLAGVAYNTHNNFAVARYLPNGQADQSFSGDGIQTISFGSASDDVVRAIALQPDDKILLVGTATNSAGSSMALARLHTNGALDASFSGDGKTTLSIGTFFTDAYTAVLQVDNKIIVVGSAKFGMSDDVALARFLPNGTLDTTFGNAGHTTTNLGSDADSGNAITIQPDGAIIVAGKTGINRDFALLRYLSNGTLDKSFGNQGVTTTDFWGFDDFANAVLLQPDGKIVCGGYAYNGTLPDFALARYLPDGTPDTNFGTDGLVTTDFDNSYDYGFPMAWQTDGKILLGGYAFGNSKTAFALARYLSGLNVGVVDFFAPLSGFIAPNPIEQSAVFEFEIVHDDLFTLTLTDMQGRVVQTFFSGKKLLASKQTEQILFPSDLQKGWYVLRLSDSAQHQLSIKILNKGG